MEKLKIRSSELAGIRTPVEFYQKKFIHKPVERDYFDIGTACHALILEPEKFENLIVVANDFPEPDKINKDGSFSKTGKNGQYLKEVKEAFPDKIIFEPYWYAQVNAYAEALKSIPGFDSLLDMNNGLTEYHMEMEQSDNIILSGTADYIKPGKFITDLKFSASITDRDIQRAFYDFDYHIRAAFYLNIWNHLNPDNPIKTFIYIFVEKSENPTARFLKVSDFDLVQAEVLMNLRLKEIETCYVSGDWILASIENNELPEWIYNKNTKF